MKVGYGVTYSRYNTLLHFMNIVDHYWDNPDINSIQLFGKDVRSILVFVCQKIAFSDHDYYHYGATVDSEHYNPPCDLLVGNENTEITPLLLSKTSSRMHQVIVTDKVFGYAFVRRVLEDVLSRHPN